MPHRQRCLSPTWTTTAVTGRLIQTGPVPIVVVDAIRPTNMTLQTKPLNAPAQWFYRAKLGPNRSGPPLPTRRSIAGGSSFASRALLVRAGALRTLEFVTRRLRCENEGMGDMNLHKIMQVTCLGQF